MRALFFKARIFCTFHTSACNAIFLFKLNRYRINVAWFCKLFGLDDLWRLALVVLLYVFEARLSKVIKTR